MASGLAQGFETAGRGLAGAEVGAGVQLGEEVRGLTSPIAQAGEACSPHELARTEGRTGMWRSEQTEAVLAAHHMLLVELARITHAHHPEAIEALRAELAGVADLGLRRGAREATALAVELQIEILDEALLPPPGGI